MPVAVLSSDPASLQSTLKGNTPVYLEPSESYPGNVEVLPKLPEPDLAVVVCCTSRTHLCLCCTFRTLIFASTKPRKGLATSAPGSRPSEGCSSCTPGAQPREEGFICVPGFWPKKGYIAHAWPKCPSFALLTSSCAGFTVLTARCLSCTLPTSMCSGLALLASRCLSLASTPVFPTIPTLPPLKFCQHLPYCLLMYHWCPTYLLLPPWHSPHPVIALVVSLQPLGSPLEVFFSIKFSLILFV